MIHVQISVRPFLLVETEAAVFYCEAWTGLEGMLIVSLQSPVVQEVKKFPKSGAHVIPMSLLLRSPICDP